MGSEMGLEWLQDLTEQFRLRYNLMYHLSDHF
jgi:hypothetical protein